MWWGEWGRESDTPLGPRRATDLKPNHLAEISRPIPFEGVDAAMDKFFDATTIGRVVVEVRAKAPK